MSTMQANGHTPTSAVDQPHTVLVVEDEPAVRDLVADLLREEGYQVEEARDGAEAIRRLDWYERHPDHLCGVLLDMMLPRVDGLSVLRHLTAVGAEVPVVAMSASREHLRAALAAGARIAVAKPFDLDRLLSAMYTTCTCPPPAH
jgi:two-component system, OmpR family, response regulator MprA